MKAISALVLAPAFFVLALSGSAQEPSSDSGERLKAIKSQFDELKSDLFFEQKKFDDRYLGELKKLEEKGQAEGNLELVLAVREEAKSFRSKAPGAAQSPHEELARLQKIYADQSAKFKAERDEKLSALVAEYRKKLSDLQEELTKKGDIDGAVAVRAVLKELPAMAAVMPPKETPAPDPKEGVVGRYVRISLEGNGRLIHLREVEVMSQRVNVARKGAASQSATQAGGDAGIAIDGEKKESGSGKVSHTPFSRDPWWEVDLGKELPLSEVLIFNREDDGLFKRLDGFKLSVLDADRNSVWEKVFPTAEVEISVKLEAVPE